MEKKLAENINKFHLVTRAIGSSIFYIGFIILIFLPKNLFGEDIFKILALVLLGFIVIILLIFNFVITRFIYKLYGYEINENYLLIKKGVLFRKISFIPIKRIQHLDKFQGPIQSLFKITTLIIYTAGSNDFIVGIPEDEIDLVIKQIRENLQVYLDSEEVIIDES